MSPAGKFPSSCSTTDTLAEASESTSAVMEHSVTVLAISNAACRVLPAFPSGTRRTPAPQLSSQRPGQMDFPFQAPCSAKATIWDLPAGNVLLARTKKHDKKKKEMLVSSNPCPSAQPGEGAMCVIRFFSLIRGSHHEFLNGPHQSAGAGRAGSCHRQGPTDGGESGRRCSTQLHF